MRLITLDFETFYDRDYSLSKLTTEAYVRDPRFEVILVGAKIDNQPPTWFSGTMQETKAWLDELNLQHAFLLAHHAHFDGFILAHHFGIKPRFYLDTLSMARPKHQSTVGGSLASLVHFYGLGEKGGELINALGKRRGDFDKDSLIRFGEYCVNDVELTLKLFNELKQDFPRGELKVIDLFVRMFTDPLVELDEDFLSGHLDEVRKSRAALADKLEQYGGKPIVMSNPKFAEFLRTLGVDPPMKISLRTGKPAYAFAKTDVGFQELLEHPHELVRTAAEVRLGLKTTIEETRTNALLGIARRGAWPIYLNYYGAHTGRASGGDGVNPQNLGRPNPEKHNSGALRRSVKAPPGHKIVAGDSSQIEARVNAYLAGQDDLVEDFRNKIDIYSKFASDIYQETVTKADKAKRFVGKTCILGLGFGMGGPKLQRTLQIGNGGTPVNLALGQCHEIVHLYRQKYRRIAHLWTMGEKALYAISKGEELAFGRDGMLRTCKDGIHLPNGMMVRYPCLTFVKGEGFVYAKNRKERAEWVRQSLSGQWDANLLTRIYGGKVIENVVQALARIVVFDQMLAIAPTYRVVLTVHDEVVTCVPSEEVASAEEALRITMSTAPTWAPDLPVACEVHSGDTYGEAK